MFKWFKERMSRVVDERLREKYEEIEKAISLNREGIMELNKNLTNLRDEIGELQKKATYEFDLESNLDEFAAITHAKEEIQVDAVSISEMQNIRVRVGRDINILDLEDQTVGFKVRDKCSYMLLGVKILRGNAYGQYRIYEGFRVTTIPTKDFTISRRKKSVSIAFLQPQKFERETILSIGRVCGEGKSTLALIGWSARPAYWETALEVIK